MMQELYPLHVQSTLQLSSYPAKSYHFSTDGNGRHVYTVGSETNDKRALYVLDVHVGKFAVYRLLYPPHGLMRLKHFYALNDGVGAMILVAENGELCVYRTCVNHARRRCIIRELLYLHNVMHCDFWSSARNDQRLIIVIVYGTTITIARIDFYSSTQSRTLMVDIEHMGLCSFAGQPFAFNDHIYLFENMLTDDGCELTGRLLQIDVTSGSIQFVRPEMDNSSGFPNDSFDGQPERMKHVERDGYLWAITERRQPAIHSLETNFANNCQTGILDIRNMRWHRTSLLDDSQQHLLFDQFALDLTDDGKLLLLERIVCINDQMITFRLLGKSTRKPESLLDIAHIAILRAHPWLRRECDTNRIAFGLPRHLI